MTHKLTLQFSFRVTKSYTYLTFLHWTGIRRTSAAPGAFLRLPAGPKVDDDGAGRRQPEDRPLGDEPHRLRGQETRAG